MEVLRIFINVTGSNQVSSGKGFFNMVLFDGECVGDYFQGKVLNGGVDTQHYYAEGKGTLSARYMMEGVDKEGKPCKIFVQNEGVHEHGFLPTTPRIYTDSEALRWLEDADLVGHLIFEGDKLIISICTKDEEEKEEFLR